MARGSDVYSQLEEGPSKLLLWLVPPVLGAAAEVAKRLTLWEERRFEDLLRRASSPDGRSWRYRKATTGLASSMFFF